MTSRPVRFRYWTVTHGDAFPRAIDSTHPTRKAAIARAFELAGGDARYWMDGNRLTYRGSRLVTVSVEAR